MCISTTHSHMINIFGHPRCVFINYIGLINCRTQLICGTYMFITQVSTTCFGTCIYTYNPQYHRSKLYKTQVSTTETHIPTTPTPYTLHTRSRTPIQKKKTPPPPYKRRMPNITAYVFLSIHQPEDGHGHKRRNMQLIPM